MENGSNGVTEFQLPEGVCASRLKDKWGESHLLFIDRFLSTRRNSGRLPLSKQKKILHGQTSHYNIRHGRKVMRSGSHWLMPTVKSRIQGGDDSPRDVS